MRVESMALELRPRTMMEAADLGLQLARTHWRSVVRTCGPVYVVVALLALSTMELANWAPMLVIFCAKPWLDRSVLFVFARAAFGQTSRFTDLWTAQRTVWWGQCLSTLTWRRLSLHRSYTQAVYQLEGQQGAAFRKRRAQILKGQAGPAGRMQLAFVHVELFIVLAGYALVLWFMPENFRADFMDLLLGEQPWTVALDTLWYMVVVACVEPLYVASGFCMYLNRRVQLEAWDIEQEFRRAF
jgi:hypothetical protein